MGRRPRHRPESDVFEIVTDSVEFYTLCYVEENTVLLYKIFCGLGGRFWDRSVFVAGAVCGYEGLYGLVLCADNVRDRGGPGIETLRRKSCNAGGDFRVYLHYHSVSDGGDLAEAARRISRS